LKRHRAGIGDVRAGRPHHNPSMKDFCGAGVSPARLDKFRPTKGEFDIEFCMMLKRQLGGK